MGSQRKKPGQQINGASDSQFHGLQAGHNLEVSDIAGGDSEAQLQGGADHHEGHQGMPGVKTEDKGVQNPPHPEQKKGGGMNMDNMKM